MHALVAIDEVKVEYDQVYFDTSIVFSGRLNLNELNGMLEWDRDGYHSDTLAASIGHEIIRQARVLYALSKDY